MEIAKAQIEQSLLSNLSSYMQAQEAQQEQNQKEADEAALEQQNS